jgi:hypothetical protein
MLYCFGSGEITSIRIACMMILSGFLFIIDIPPHKRGPWLFVYYGKFVYTPIGTAGINGYAVVGTVIMIPGFVGGSAVVKYPADFEFSLRGDKGGIFENF